MKRNLFYFTIFLTFCQCISCSKSKNENKINSTNTVELPAVLKQIPVVKLKPIIEMVGDAKVIGLSESSHFKNESLDFRNDLIKFLVGEKRIDVIALESGIIESKHLFDYVNGSNENLDSVLFNGLSWTFDKIPQNREIIEWLRNYNADSKNPHKVKLYGYDIPGSPLNPIANQKLTTALDKALAYLHLVDAQNWEMFINRLMPFNKYIHIDIAHPSVNQYINLDKVARNELTQIIVDLVNCYKVNQEDYITLTSQEKYDWAYYSVISSKHVDDWLQTIPSDFKMTKEIQRTIFSHFFWKLHEKRDLTMFRNVEWIISREQNSNILLFGHINHISKSPQTIVTKDSTHIHKGKQLGHYLNEAYPNDYKAIGNFHYVTTNQSDTNFLADDSFEKMVFDQNNLNHYRRILEEDNFNMNKEWKFGEAFLNASHLMNPYQGIDILLFTPNQTDVGIE